MTIIFSMLTYTLYMLVNFLPRFHAMIPASLLVGGAGTILWFSTSKVSGFAEERSGKWENEIVFCSIKHCCM